MKNLAKKIAFAMALFAVFFTGCNNDVGGSIGNGALFALLQQKSNESSTTIKSLNVIATSDDKVVDFGGSRTILPGSLDASKLTFYLWGTDQINADKHTDLKIPRIVTFNPTGTDGTTGTVPVNLSVSSYKLKLAAVYTKDPADGTTDNLPTGPLTEAKVLEKAVVYGVADVDLRYNQEVKFYLNPSNIEGTGTVDIPLRTLAGWTNADFSVTVRLENKNDNSTVAGSEQSWYAIGEFNSATAEAANTATGVTEKKFAGTDGVEYLVKNVPAGSYNLVIDFWNADTLGAGKHFYYSDTVMVLTGQISNKTNSNPLSNDIVDVPNVISNPPAPPKNLRVGYNIPTSRAEGKYLATFEWDDESYNEEYFILELLDLTKCVDGTPANNDKTGLKKTVSDSLFALMNEADIQETAVKTITNWEPLAAADNVEKYMFRNTDYQNFNTMYAAGSLNKGSTSVSLWLPLGSVYAARLTSFNDYYTGPDADFDAGETNSKLPWIYANLAALTTTAPRSVVLATNTDGTFLKSNEVLGSTPKSWNDKDSAKIEGDEPLGINLYRLEYSLNGGKFQSVSEYGVPASWNNPVQITDTTNMDGLEPKYYNFITNYGNLTFAANDAAVAAAAAAGDDYTINGKPILDPTIWHYKDDPDDYATLYNGKLVFKSWLKDNIAGSLYSKINWNRSTTAGSDAASTYVLSEYGVINVQGNPKYTDFASIAPTLSKDGNYYTNKVMAAPSYLGFDNLNLFANFGSADGGADIDNPEQYKLHTQNVRLYKWKGTANTTYPFTTSETAEDGEYITSDAQPITSNCDTTDVYDDGEVHSGTIKISTWYSNVSFLVVENELKADDTEATPDKNIWTSASLRIKNNKEYVPNGTFDGIRTTYVVTNTTKGSKENVVTGEATAADAGDAGSDPLLTYEGGTSDTFNEHDAYYFVVSTSLFMPGNKYTAVLHVDTPENKEGYNYEVYLEITEPEYDVTTAPDDGDCSFVAIGAYTDESEKTYYQWDGAKFFKSSYKTAKSAAEWKDTGDATKQLYTLKTGAVPLY